ncbi:putative lipase 8 precursor [Aspergillus steynii IBT 23096]|uniref:Putative lipase 8 n=1 Tax=Aspergillus steynii IBT 23096 TaxID=1392250 RepID=A0A2I2FWM7_9EURO|nr:putative lipase 8 precursor [Aspergillus steynii IBT 23096]PLB45042.1 putative lipase 8 precursor [Aspergillus steynii IBT 23096]
MLHIASVLLIVAGQLLAINPSSTNTPNQHSPPLLPTQDPFYKPDNSSWESSPPGKIIKSRAVNLTSTIIDLSIVQSAHQHLYRTSDAHGCPSYAVTTVLIPKNATDRHFLSFQVAYDSPDSNCSPSYWAQDGVPANPYGIFGDFSTLIQTFLSQGIPISIPDYEGVNASFTVGTQSGYAVLDSLRAVQRSGSIVGASSATKAAMLGYSGGALATEWATELHAVYAPDVQISGAAIGGLPTNITKTFFAINGTPSAGLISAAFNGIANTFPCFGSYLDRHLLPERAGQFYSTKYQCSRGSRGGLGQMSPCWEPRMSAYFDNGDRIVYDHATLLNTFGTMGSHGTPICPLYIWKGTNDEIAPPIEDTDALVKSYCAGGTNITYVRVENGTHRDAMVAGIPGAMAFLKSLLGGRGLDRCTSTTIPIVRA